MGKTTDHPRSIIARNAAELIRLHGRVRETFLQRDKGAPQKAEWRNACTEFHEKYPSLAFPGGYEEALEKFRLGDPAVIEPALCFVELRPYFFRSGYMFQTLLRRLKGADLSSQQRARLDDVVQRLAAWRAQKAASQPE